VGARSGGGTGRDLTRERGRPQMYGDVKEGLIDMGSKVDGGGRGEEEKEAAKRGSGLRGSDGSVSLLSSWIYHKHKSTIQPSNL
jgi:hypothetical protein